MLRQIQKHQGQIKRVPRGETPLIELDLDECRTVVSVSLEPSSPVARSRRYKTVDWDYTVFTEWRDDGRPGPVFFFLQLPRSA